MTIYTIGYAATYDAHLAAEPNPIKCGRNPTDDGVPHEGGAAFETIEDALAYLRGRGVKASDWGVYELAGRWGDTTLNLRGMPYRNLVYDTPIIRRVA